MAPRSFWLMKSEPSVFSLDDLAARRSTSWDGVRNYQARNFLRACREGDGVLFYHSGIDEPAVAGTARVVRTAYPDPSQFDARSPYHDPTSTADTPRWDAVDLAFEARFARPVTLERMRTTPGLENMAVVRRGNRLSVMPVTPAEWKIVLSLGKRAAR